MSVIKSTLAKVEQDGIPYVVWKNTHKLDEALKTGFNVDLYIPPRSRKLFEDFMAKNGWISGESKKSKHKFIAHYYNGEDGETIYHLHVYFGLVTGEHDLKEFDVPVDEIYERCVVRDSKSGLLMFDDSAVACLFFIRHFLKSASYISRKGYSAKLVSSAGEVSVEAIESAAGSGCLPINDTNWIKRSNLFKQRMELPSSADAFLFRWKMRKYLIYPVWQVPIRRNVRYLWFRLLGGLSRRLSFIDPPGCKKVRQGFVVAFSGAEAAGKSTLVKEVSGRLQREFCVKKYHLGKPPSALACLLKVLSRIKRTVKRSPSSMDTKEMTAEDLPRKGRNNTSIYLLRSLEVAFARYCLSKYCRYLSNKGYLVVADRWPTEQPGMMDGPRIYKHPEFSGWFYAALGAIEYYFYKKVAQSDLCVYLDVDVQTAIGRNESRIKLGKETAEQVIARHERNAEFTPKGKKVVCYKNVSSLEVAVRELVSIAWVEISAANSKQVSEGKSG